MNHDQFDEFDQSDDHAAPEADRGVTRDGNADAAGDPLPAAASPVQESRRIEAELDDREAVLADWNYHMTEAYGRYWADDDLPPDASAAYGERIDAVRDGVDAAGLRAMTARHFPPESLSGGETDDTAAAVTGARAAVRQVTAHRDAAEHDADGEPATDTSAYDADRSDDGITR
ncbi:MAG TPA: hypothetical protein VGO94_02380 [Mycobacteriales bacterium]|jgi:hypothetical protein|nr:hypothetical protein [Mycobacteriales bacterium]